MPGHSLFSPQLPQMRNLPTSNATNLPSSCDEELADEADEPPDEQTGYFFIRNYHISSFSDREFSKHSICNNAPPKESLLTKAFLTSPILGPVDHMVPPNLERGMSNSSVWSNTSGTSTADLTSDAGMTSPSRVSTPSPPPPMYLSGITGIMQGTKNVATFNEPSQIEIVTDKDEGLSRKRCITFACADGQLSRRTAEEKAIKAVVHENKQAETVAPKRNGLTFVCTQREDTRKSNIRPLRSPHPASRCLDSDQQPKHAVAGITAPAKPPTPAPKVAYPEPRQLYDSESAADSWTNQPIDKTRLLRVDDVLRKEMDIRRLSEEVEQEELQNEDEDDDEGNDALVDGDDDDNDDQDEDGDDDQDDDVEDDEEYDEDNDEDDYDGESGNETDNEEGFASDDESDDEIFFGLHPPMVVPLATPGISIQSSRKGVTSPRLIRPTTPDLPDSTDFVCGTFDEDKALEEAYLSCLEERKRSKHKTTPQDIDPSFPTSDLEDSDEESKPRHHIAKVNRDDSSSDGNQSRGRKLRGGVTKSHSPPQGRVHSPAPVRRTALAQSPAPNRRVVSKSRHSSPAPLSRRGSRVLSPAPLRRRTHFQTGHNIVRTRSLPRNGRSKAYTTAGSPQKPTRPMVIRRGAMDIFKGLEKKRERRKARLSRKDKGESWRAGEGVEKMRELGLEICGKGKALPIWVMSV